MENEIKTLSVGALVPDFEMETYNPAEGEFAKITLAEIKAAGKLRVEGKTYVMKDGDICHFLFN